MQWQIQEAKARFSEMVECTLEEGPQTVTCQGKPVAVLVPVDEYRRLRTGGKSFKILGASAPLGGVRDPTFVRLRFVPRVSRVIQDRLGKSLGTLSFKPSGDLALNYVISLEFGRPVVLSISQIDDAAETAALSKIIALFFLGFEQEIRVMR